jgi:hypothetical protein
MTDGQLNINEALSWIGTLFPVGTPGKIVISHSRPTGGGFPSVALDPEDSGSIGGVITRADALGAPGIYLRCTTVSGTSEGSRGKDSDSLYLPGIWADIDIEGPGHRHDPARHSGRRLPADRDAAMGIVAESGLPVPTVWVDSGGGLYPWWLTGGTMIDGHSRQSISELLVRWQAVLHASAARLGLHYGTEVSDLSRVLRLPGTTNRKVSGNPRPCRVVDYGGSGMTYSLDDMHIVAARLPVVEPAASRSTSGARMSAPPAKVSAGTPVDPDMPVVASVLRDADHVSPLDALEVRHTWAEILQPMGWTLVSGVEGEGECRWRHPDATHPESATSGRSTDRDRLWVFSENTPLPAGESLTKGYVYATLYHGGDMSKAARAVQAMGYGARSSSPGGGLPGGDEVEAERRLELAPASGMRMRAARWLWAEGEGGAQPAQWLPLGGLSLLGGREGMGKTTVTYRIISELTRGTLAGDLYGQPRGAVIAATEDDWGVTIVPRLVAAGADLERVYRVDVVEPDRRTGVSLPEDLSALSTLLGEHPDIALLVLDPIITVLSARLDSHKDHEVRKALEPISTMAHERGVSVIGLIHDNKTKDTDLSTRLMGSRAFVAVARAALVCAEEAEDAAGEVDDLGADVGTDPSGDEPVRASALAPGRTFLLGQVKSNLGPKVQWSIRYQIDGVKVGHDDDAGKDIVGSKITRIGRRLEGLEETVRAAEGARRGAGTSREEIKASILAALPADGTEVEGAEVKAELREEGYSLRTIMRAVKDLEDAGKIRSVRSVENGRKVLWSLPTPSPTKTVSRMASMESTSHMTHDTCVSPSLKGESFSEGESMSCATVPLSPRATHVGTSAPCGTPGCEGDDHVPWCTSGHGMTA